MTLFDMIKDWRRVSIEKVPDNEVTEFNHNKVAAMRERVGEDATILQLEGYNGPLFASGLTLVAFYIVALSQSGDIIATEQTFIS